LICDLPITGKKPTAPDSVPGLHPCTPLGDLRSCVWSPENYLN